MTLAMSVPQVQKKLLKELRVVGSWEKLAARYSDAALKVNKGTLWTLAKHGVVPTNQELRFRLGLEVRPAPAWVGQVAGFLAEREIGDPIQGPRLYGRGGRLVKL